MRKGTWKQTRQITYEQMKVYGEQFRKVRDPTGMSLRQFAPLLGVSLSSLHRWEKGKLIPQTDIRYIDRKIRSIAANYVMQG